MSKKRFEIYDVNVSMSEPVTTNEWCCMSPFPGLSIILDFEGEDTRAYRVVDAMIVADEDDYYWRLSVETHAAWRSRLAEHGPT